jgi:hypothetical protein
MRWRTWRAISGSPSILVLRGLAAVIRHRGDEERSMHYDVLMSAEQRAVKGKKGLQNKVRPDRYCLPSHQTHSEALFLCGAIL